MPQENNEHQTFEKKLCSRLEQPSSERSKIFRGSQKLHINKTLKFAVTKRSKLKNKANKFKS